jgi:hypothetical protein
MSSILFLTLVHPDFLPPVYASAQVLASKGYHIDIYTFESEAPEKFNAGSGIRINIIGKHAGTFNQRAAARKKFDEQVAAYVTETRPKAIICFCEFSYLTALKHYPNIPVMYFALELVDFAIKNLFRSPFSTIRSWQATSQLHKAKYICTPSYERSGWLAGRYALQIIPDTVLNAPFISHDFHLTKQYTTTLLPGHFRNKVKILNTGGVNGTRSVKELVLGFEKSSSDTCLVITNVGQSAYSNEIRSLVDRSARKNDILLLGTVSRKDLIELQQSCDIGICLMKLQDGFDARMIAPNKVGEYFYSGLLVLGMNTPYFHQFIPYNITQLVDEPDPDQIAAALDRLSNLVAQSGYHSRIELCLREWYNMGRQMETAIKLIEKI